VTRILISRKRLGKYIPARVNASKNKTSIARQRFSKDAFLTIEAVFPVGFLQSYYKSVFGSIGPNRNSRDNRLDFETPACRDMNLGAEELN
jgi:hypothetical protein